MKKSVLYVLGIFIFLHTLLFFTGKTWLYKAFFITYMKGYSSAYIHDFIYFNNDTISSFKHQPWLVSSNYNTQSVPNSFFRLNDSLETVAFLIIQNDSIKFETYWEGYSSDTMSNSFSMAKSFVSALIGIAITEGYIKTIDAPVCNFIPAFCDSDKEKITVKHLLTMSSGLDWEENYKNPFSQTADAYYGSNLRGLILGLNVFEAPGKVFNYSSSSTQILSFVLESATGKTISKYASEKLWSPIGAKHIALWGKDKKNGAEKAFCCISSNARDFARIGKLFLSNGSWKGKKLIDSNYIYNAITPASLLTDSGKKNDFYGYHFWITKYNGLSVYYARGLYGQYIICIPEKNAIIVRLGRKWKLLLKNQHHSDLYDFIDASLKIIN